ncbi:Phosphoadenosine phosphosulfate reductase [Granulibacter bethesdensis]|uniref:phosphoadenylyl-sulfate reductase n=1 Tax=Granulibacter bethesdensis TaxID=364410 RepID=UPI00090C3AF4|nr:phosphoadenylyl-sulfate reductase [Granulibacter bethesdensis]APH56332.1 Phosphoadenosine phosphosulfate reductase [Granulibacter bethesdensis]
MQMQDAELEKQLQDDATAAREASLHPVRDAVSIPHGAGLPLLHQAITEEFAGRIAVVSSFGAESALLLALVAEIDPAIPIVFLETERHFPETLAYRQQLADLLGLTGIRDIHPDPEEAAAQDPDAELWYFDADACCALRKVRPLEKALSGFDAWISGRKRHQASTRAALPFREIEGKFTKFNPLADWGAADIEAEMTRRQLPRHPLVAKGYPSIGCAPCTQPVAPGADPRSGRWRGRAKTECGIHRPTG